MTIKLGTKVRDTLTGFQGTATARCRYVNGCVQFAVEKLGDNGKIIEHWFDDVRLEKLKTQKSTFPVSSKRGGSRRSTPPRRSHPQL